MVRNVSIISNIENISRPKRVEVIAAVLAKNIAQAYNAAIAAPSDRNSKLTSRLATLLVAYNIIEFIKKLSKNRTSMYITASKITPP